MFSDRHLGSTQDSRMDALLKRMEGFPCTFNLEGRPPNRQRLQHMKNNVSTDKPVGKYATTQRIRNKNILTWLEYKLDPEDNKAKQINQEVITETEGLNISALGNRVFILSHESNEIDASDYLKELEGMKYRPDFQDLITEAKAEQAYYYSRMGGFNNCDMSLKLFKYVVQLRPDNHLWKFGLGLMHRRMTNFNVSYSLVNQSNTAENIRRAKDCLLDVTESDDDELQALAYTQLIILFYTYSTSHEGQCFQGFDILSLCEKALEKGGENSTVLSHCGRVFMKYDIDRAIVLLEKALSKRQNTISYHNLGQCFERKAELICISGNENLEGKTMDQELQCKTVSESKPSEEQLQSFDIDHTIVLKRHLMSSKANLDEGSDFVKKSEDMYQKAITISKNENVPAMLSLGKLYARLNRFKEALQKFRQIINLDQTKRSYLITLITAYEGAGKCLLELSKMHQEKSHEFYEQGKEYLTKATSLAADLACIKSGPRHCETSVWESFEILKEDIYRMDECKAKGKEYVNLLGLIKDNRGVVTAIEDILKSETKLDDPEMVLWAVNSYLEIGEYENALTFVNIVSLFASGISLKDKENTEPEGSKIKILKDAFTKVFLLVAWERLDKKSLDAKLMFQKSFAINYGVGTDHFSENEEDFAAVILIVSDYEIDCEEGLGQSTKFSIYLQHILSDVFGLKTFLNLEGSDEYGCSEDVLRLSEVKKYPILLLMLADGERGPFFDYILSILHQIKDDFDKPLNWFIIQSNENIRLPDTLLHCNERRLTLSEDNPILSNANSSCSSYDLNRCETEKACTLPNDIDCERLMEMFCFLLRLDFKNVRDVYIQSKNFVSDES
ncbi:unnamed protein product [Lymnaea stagnalis]|uniref:Uncharacterized protein n=1 Tax=Lymnaea stagnalis TaxID=6523 RepID=A0AAV2HED7_LYMST